MERNFHTATLIVNLNDRALEIPPHYGAATSVFGALKDSVFFFGGDMGKLNVPSTLLYLFNATQLEWNAVTNSQGMIPDRRRYLCAIADNNDMIYLSGGEFIIQQSFKTSNEINIFDTHIDNWSVDEHGLFRRKGHTVTFLPNTNEIIYIGGYGDNDFIDITNLDIYNTIGNTWRRIATKNPPEQRYLHTAVLTNDNRIVIFGGVGSIQTEWPIQISTDTPVQNYYVVLNLNTSEWYNGAKINEINGAPYRGHTATLVDGYMFIAFGNIYSASKKFNNDILIYKIEDYANFTEVNTIYPEDLIHKNPNNFVVIIIGATLAVVTILLGFVGFKFRKQTIIKYSGGRPPLSLIPIP
ncbi:hypothetical protein C1645_836477 [Glomus cerebriforme]|uniref:Attractin/MKLN-like beta-propeller domain-containing protein n=1 Tax=Glomus cerebriforme TaxID=658196 RepID=A0A397SG59_9GLOM|nr:hypothetical protein C1645_836477 [Glomus cerebriforme]